MQRPPGDAPKEWGRELDGPETGAPLPSRRAALDRALEAMANPQFGPVLVTGGPGVGKSWLCRALRGEGPANWRWARVDLSPSLGAHGLFRRLLRELGKAPTESLGPDDARAEIDDALAAASLDGLSWALLLDEAHNGADSVLEEVRLLSNRLGRPDGFAAIVLAGQTGLLGRLSRGGLASLGLRITTRAHLRALTLAETVEYLSQIEPEVARNRRLDEQRHRATGGNPRLLAIGATAPHAPARRLPDSRDDGDRHSALETKATPSAAFGDLPIVPVRPPLRVGEGMVEVGWEGPDGPTEDDPADRGDSFVEWPPDEDDAEGVAELAPSDEPIRDHYAALQAWGEWSRNNQGRSDPEAPGGLAQTEASVEDGPSPVQNAPDVRAEAEHGFAPYGQLFSRLRQARDNS